MATRTVTGKRFVKVDLDEIIKGADFEEMRFNIEALNLTGAEIDIWFRKNNAKGKIVKQLSETSGITIVDASNFTVESFNIEWNAGTYYYDIKIVLSTGETKKPFYGRIEIKEDTDE